MYRRHPLGKSIKVSSSDRRWCLEVRGYSRHRSLGRQPLARTSDVADHDRGAFRFLQHMISERRLKYTAVAQFCFFHQQTEVEPTGTAANQYNLHIANPSKMFSILVIAWERRGIRVLVAVPLTIPSCHVRCTKVAHDQTQGR